MIKDILSIYHVDATILQWTMAIILIIALLPMCICFTMLYAIELAGLGMTIKSLKIRHKKFLAGKKVTYLKRDTLTGRNRKHSGPLKRPPNTSDI